ncbi:MAG: hypothetical protein K8U57_36070 [Planctomycetes bacterium]|nr:hypothetical protein [Planctomycetota bacterium]
MTEPSEARRTKRWLFAFFAFNLALTVASAWFLFHPQHADMIAPGGNIVYFDPLTWLSTP